MSAQTSPERSSADAMVRGKPCQQRSRGEMEFIKEKQFSAKKVPRGKNWRKGSWLEESRGCGGAHRKHLQNDELVEYALGHCGLFQSVPRDPREIQSQHRPLKSNKFSAAYCHASSVQRSRKLTKIGRASCRERV